MDKFSATIQASISLGFDESETAADEDKEASELRQATEPTDQYIVMVLKKLWPKRLWPAESWPKK